MIKAKILIYPCVGGSYSGQLSNEITNDLTAMGVGYRNCIAGLGSDQEEFIKAARTADINVVIDGCSAGCANPTFDFR